MHAPVLSRVHAQVLSPVPAPRFGGMSTLPQNQDRATFAPPPRCPRPANEADPTRVPSRLTADTARLNAAIAIIFEHSSDADWPVQVAEARLGRQPRSGEPTSEAGAACAGESAER